MKHDAADYKEYAECILALCGGKKNICSAEHCATRLRLQFADDSLVDKNALKLLPYVSGIVERMNCLHIVVGTDVFKLYPFSLIFQLKERLIYSFAGLLSQMCQFVAGTTTKATPSIR